MVNQLFYRFGIVIFIAGVIAVLLQNAGIIDPVRLFSPCVFHQLSGLYCPGCGGTRAVKALLSGNLILCFRYHPFVFYFFIMYALFMVSHSTAAVKNIFLKKRHKNGLPRKTHREPSSKKTTRKNIFASGLDFKVSYVYIGIVIILLQWMIKNVTVLLRYSNY